MKKCYNLPQLLALLGLIANLSACTGGPTIPPSVTAEQPAAVAEQCEENKQATTPQEAKQQYIERFGEPKIEFEGTKVVITTQRLRIATVAMEDIDDYHNFIYSSPKVMEKFADGQTRDYGRVLARVEGWIERQKNGSPFVGLTIRMKDSGVFIGNVVLGVGEEANSSELAYMLREDKWQQGFGYEAVGAVVLFYGLQLNQQSYLLPVGNGGDQSFERIIATARVDNEASVKIQKKLGMEKYKESNKFGHARHHYELSMVELLSVADSYQKTDQYTM